MRVTNNIIHSQVSFNMQRSIRRFLQMQTSMSSGKRVNTPSDDPSGTVRGMTYQGELNQVAQQKRNTAQGMNWVTTYDTAMADMSDFLSTAKEIAVAMSNGTYDEVARDGSATEIQSLIDQMIQLGNSQLEGRYIFGGFQTRARALELAANGVVFRGDFGKIDFEVESSLKLTINSNGADVFLKRLSILGENADLNAGVSVNTLVGDLNNGTGLSLSPGTFTVTDQNLGITSTVSISGSTTLGQVISTINTRLALDGLTNLTVSLGDEGNNIKVDTTQTGQVSLITPLSVLNNGQGLDLTPGKVRVTDGAGIDVQVDLSSASTVGDIITQFNSQLATAGVSNVTMSLNATNTGFNITDSNGVPLGLSISETGTYENTANSLGIIGAVTPVLNGAGLQPQVNFLVSELGGTTASRLGILGTITSDFPGGDLNPVLKSDTPIALLNNGNGFGRNEILLALGEQTARFDLRDSNFLIVQDVLNAVNNSGLNIRASVNTARSGIQIVNNDPTRSFTIEDVDGRAARDLGIYGSGDMMGSLMILHKALKQNDQEAAGKLLENLDSAILHLLSERANVGARTIRLESTLSRQEGQELNFTELFSATIDADLPSLVTTLSTYENNYRSALLASAKIIQPSLLDFLSR